jgi:hypothetical protein
MNTICTTVICFKNLRYGCSQNAYDIKVSKCSLVSLSLLFLPFHVWRANSWTSRSSLTDYAVLENWDMWKILLKENFAGLETCCLGIDWSFTIYRVFYSFMCCVKNECKHVDLNCTLTNIRKEANGRLSWTQFSIFGFYLRERLVEQRSRNTLYNKVSPFFP